MRMMFLSAWLAFLWVAMIPFTVSFSVVSPRAVSTTGLAMSSIFAEIDDGEIIRTDKPPSLDWEIDCYSRPVLKKNKKLWEILITDSNGSFRFCKSVPSALVNSKEVRAVVQSVLDEAPVKPRKIRFFRQEMLNMLNIALSDLDVSIRPSRCTPMLGQWLEERHQRVYPMMKGYKASMVTNAMRDTPFGKPGPPSRLPDGLRGEKYAFVGVPLAEVLPGGSITPENIGFGRMCPIPPDISSMGDSFLQGVVILSDRARVLAQFLASAELVALTCDLRKRELLMEAGIKDSFLMAKLNDVQRQEARIFEEGKLVHKGLHFVSIQTDANVDPTGFWLLRKLPPNI